MTPTLQQLSITFTLTFILSGCLVMATDPNEPIFDDSTGSSEPAVNSDLPSYTITPFEMDSSSQRAGQISSSALSITISIDEGNGSLADITVTLSAFSDARCTQPGLGTLTGNSTTTHSSGTALFDQLSYDYPESIYLKITAGDSSHCHQTPIEWIAPTLAQSGSGSHCAILNGQAYCWGGNDYGRIGIGNTVDQLTAVPVAGLDDGITQFSSGHNATNCAVDSGVLKCWGENWSSQVGNGLTESSRSTPQTVAELSTVVTATSVGYDHTCAISNGALYCWGNAHLTPNTGDIVFSPTIVSGLGSGVTSVGSGDNHTCAVKDGNVYCWGYHFNGNLGLGHGNDSDDPTPVLGISGQAETLTTGWSHSCLTQTTGETYCWGANNYGQLGDGTTNNRNIAVHISALQTTPSQISAGAYHTCAIVDHAALCWGYNNNGQLGDGTTTDRHTPTSVVGLPGKVTSIKTGYYSTCAVSSGSVYCWGQGNNGTLGNGATTHSLSPVEVSGIE